MLIFTGHYRKPVVFNDETMQSAERSLARLRSALRPAQGGLTAGEAADTLRMAAENARAAFVAAMDDDFNTAGRAWRPVRAGARHQHRPHRRRRRALLSSRPGHTARAGRRPGLDAAEPAAETVTDVAARPFIDLLVTVRGDLRAAKQWALADKVRNELKALGVVMDDTPEGTKWRFEKEAASL